MSLVSRFFVALLIPIVVFFGMKRFSPRHIWAGTGLAIGLVLWHLMLAFVFTLMISRVVLLGGISMGILYSVYFLPSKVLWMLIDAGHNSRLGSDQFSSSNVIVSALFWGCLGSVMGHFIDRRRESLATPEVFS